MRLRTALSVAAAAAFVIGPTTIAPAQAGQQPALIRGEVCFWPEPNMMGPGGGWCYSGTGYTDVPARIHDHAGSFESRSDDTVYAIDHPRWGGCTYRTIPGRAYDMDWRADDDFGNKIDGVSDSKGDCQPG
ncbi:hypothetical protein [Streptomyces indicus]|uniref:Peptidase inhibitor family I36 n=1 Tax=Streptomyces indicus TaxID=417292 RepID=A0A1G8V0P4_9ACTN|nr:hypothetical protein [Streptomyces indicus]SDJ59641.1 hypothetical protein SAMN05421806_1011183 [Streptomyces indicus]